MDEPETIRAWVEKAAEDLGAAAALSERGFDALASFHAQQAAEKALKALRIHRGLGLTKTHDLDRLATGLGAPAAIGEHCSLLTTYYIATRYPDLSAGPDHAEAAAAIARAEEVVAWCRKQIS